MTRTGLILPVLVLSLPVPVYGTPDRSCLTLTLSVRVSTPFCLGTVTQATVFSDHKLHLLIADTLFKWCFAGVGLQIGLCGCKLIINPF